MKVSLAIHVVAFVSSVSARLSEIHSRPGEDVHSDGSALLVHAPKSNTEGYQYDRKLQAFNNVTNVALGKPTSQSSTGWGGFSSRAVDGNPNGKWSKWSTTHTAKQTNPSWEVDLLDDFSVSNIKIYNRVDCCSGRLSGAEVTLYDETKTNSLTLAGPPNTFRLDSFTLDFATENLAFPTRFVVVSLPGQNEYLSLAEVVVNGVPSSPAALCQVKECNDNNACTTDRCNTTTGECEFSPIAGCKDVQPDVLEFYLAKEDMTVTYGELVEMLSANGLTTKGNTTRTRRNVRGLQTTFDFLPDCHFLLPEGSLEERELSFSYLVCDVQVADGVSVVSTALAASCKNNEALSECSGDVFTIGSDIQLGSDGSELNVELSLPATDICTGVSKEEAKACWRASVDIISAGIAIGDPNGNELSFGASIGFGGGASGGLDDGVLCANVSFKFGIGFDLGFCARLGKKCSEFDSVALCCRDRTLEGLNPESFRQCLIDRDVDPTIDDVHLNGAIVDWCRGAVVFEGGDPNAYRKCLTDRGLPATFDDAHLNREILNHCRASVNEGGDPDAYRKCFTDRGLPATFDDKRLNQEILNHCRAWVVEGREPNAYRKCFTDRGLPATFDDAHLNGEIRNHCRSWVVAGADPNAFRKCFTDRGLPATFDDAHLNQEIVNHCRFAVVEGLDPNAFRKCLTDRGLPATFDDAHLKQQIVNHCRFAVIEGRDPNAFRKCFSDRGLPRDTDDVRLKQEIINHCRASVLEGANPNAFRKCLTDRGIPANSDDASLRRQIIAYCDGACVFGGCKSQCRKDRGI